jgi:phage terminase large subunit-like protein
VIVGEANYGGAMVEATIQAAKRQVGGSRAPYKSVTATRGKVVRAEPIAALYEQGKVRHVGYYPELEDELVAFSTFGYVGDRSPNRADALIWAITELFPGVVSGRGVSKPIHYPSLGLPGRR